jgi:hypothetical protein
MASSTLLTPSSGRSGFKTALWISLGLTSLFVFITSEVLLVTDYHMYHAYRLQVIADRQILIPHTLCGLIALLAGPLQFSSRLRQRHLKFHRVLGRMYVISVFIGALTGIALSAGRPGMPGTCMQAGAWIVCTTAAVITARNRQITQHRQWMVRSYAVTFTFVSTRVLNLWPRYWSHLGDTFAALGLIAFTLASLLIVELGLNWRELTTRRAGRPRAVRSTTPLPPNQISGIMPGVRLEIHAHGWDRSANPLCAGLTETLESSRICRLQESDLWK